MGKEVKLLSPRMYEYESQARLHCPFLEIAGVDEAGRGPWAGPVVVAALILPPEQEFFLPVDDSKRLSATRRQKLAAALRADSRLRYAISVQSAAEIDRINILAATHAGMRAAVLQLTPRPGLALVDGLPVPDFPVPARFIVKGDANSASIAAASILAKTFRDQLMEEMDAIYPEYGFAAHKGYGTAAHLKALQKYGPCPEHRRSFAPVRKVIQKTPLQLKLPWTEMPENTCKQTPKPEI